MDNKIDLDSRLSVEGLDAALKIAARIVVLYGGDYLPVFERMRKEVAYETEKKETKNLAIELAKKYAFLE